MTIEQASAVNVLLDYLTNTYPDHDEHAKARSAAVTLARGAHKKLAAGWTPDRIAAEWPDAHEVDAQLALWFTPQCIRDHFDGDDDERAKWVADATQDDLAEIGHDALADDGIYRAFHEALAGGVDDAMERA